MLDDGGSCGSEESSTTNSSAATETQYWKVSRFGEDFNDYSGSDHVKAADERHYGIYLLADSSPNDANNTTLSLYRKRILIVDDEEDNALTIKKALLYNGFEKVETYNDPLLAMKHFTADLCDLLILDIVMPLIDGFALYEKMKKIDNKVKVCFITAFDINYQIGRAHV